MNWDGNSFYLAFFNIDMMAASDAGEFPAIFFEYPGEIPA